MLIAEPILRPIEVRPPAFTHEGEVTVRAAQIADAQGICEVIERCAETAAVLRRELDDVLFAINSFVVAEMNGQIIGCAALAVVDRELAEIRSVSVDPRIQTKGVGRRMVQHLLEVALQMGISRVFLLTKVPEFFERVGFTAIDPALLADAFLDDLMHLQRRTYANKYVMIRDVSW